MSGQNGACHFEKPGCGLGFLTPHARGLRGGHDGAAHVSVGDIQIVDVPAGFFQEQEGAGHDEFDVVRVRGNGEGRGHDSQVARVGSG